MFAEEQGAPFLKWPGGKRWTASHIAAIIRDRLGGTYFEPFVGGGAVFFCLKPQKALLSDINAELIETYTAVRDHPEAIVRRLKDLRVNETEYYRIRASQPRDRISRSVRFLYLNRTGFAGMYRVNHSGQFNVPYGGGERTPETLWRNGILASASHALRLAEVRQGDFQCFLDAARKGDVVYCDPAYTVAHDRNGFIRYNERHFCWADQLRLAEAALRASRRGVTVVITNAHHASVRALYPGARSETLERRSCVSRDPARRRSVREYLFVL